MTADFPENRVVKIWQDCAGRDDLELEEGGPVKILYPGRLNGGGGADFREAVIQTQQGIITGDIEVHVKTSHWRAHRHHLDPVYNRVVLHVVFRHDLAGSVILQNGHTAPTLALQTICAPGGKPGFSFFMPEKSCGVGGAGGFRILNGILDEAGEQRFRARSAGFQTFLSPEDAEQALYRGIMTALGYSRNKHQMSELACRMPLRQLGAIAAEKPEPERLSVYQAMLLGAAGLVSLQHVRGQPDNAAEIRNNRPGEIWSAAGENVMMQAADWQFGGVRPVNHPVRRLVAMSRLLLRYQETGLLQGLMGKLEATAGDGKYQELEAALMVAEGDSRTALLGKNRAADIIVNVLLPFAAAWGWRNARPELARKAEDIYRRYPPLTSNEIERQMNRQLGIDKKPVGTARRQQGLLHIYKTYCVLGMCRECPVKQGV